MSKSRDATPAHRHGRALSRGDTLSRGACPTLAAPMQTGDGLLVRLTPAVGEITMAQLAALARSAHRHGNDLLEITLRGALQIRGLSPASAAALANDVAAMKLDVRQGLAIDINPLAGIDPEQLLDPRPLARMIGHGVARSSYVDALGPKVSVTIDGGGQLPLSGLKTDIRINAVALHLAAASASPQWQMTLALANGEYRCFAGAGPAVGHAALRLLGLIAQHGEKLGVHARIRHIPAAAADIACAGLTALPPTKQHDQTRIPVGSFASQPEPTIGVTPSFGVMRSSVLMQLATAFPQASVRLAPGRGLLLTGLSPAERAALPALADELGLIWRKDDLRLRIQACAGAPHCASAAIATRQIAADLARDNAALLKHALGNERQLFISGCAKRCGAPSAHVTALALPRGAAVISGANPSPASADLLAALQALATHHAAPCDCDSSHSCALPASPKSETRI